jgi:hypothetical protein
VGPKEAQNEGTIVLYPSLDSPVKPTLPKVDISKLTIDQKMGRFYQICENRKNKHNLGTQVGLERHIFGLLNKTRHNLMKDGNHKNRFDINAKKVLRAARAYYDHKLEFAFGFKKLRRKISRSNCLDPALNKGFVPYMDLLTDQIFQEELLQLFKVSRESVSNHLAALVCPKAFQSELEDLAPLFLAENQSPYIRRMSTINSLAIKSRDLLYQYNKEKLNSFMDTIENLLIVESFLLMQGLFGQIIDEQST